MSINTYPLKISSVFKESDYSYGNRNITASEADIRYMKIDDMRIAGEATMLNGIINVNHQECLITSKIFLTYAELPTSSGGHLYVSNVGNGTFTIRSTSGSDHSKVNYLIIN